jgi:hypothetical protein
MSRQLVRRINRLQRLRRDCDWPCPMFPSYCSRFQTTRRLSRDSEIDWVVSGGRLGTLRVLSDNTNPHNIALLPDRSKRTRQGGGHGLRGLGLGLLAFKFGGQDAAGTS